MSKLPQFLDLFLSLVAQPLFYPHSIKEIYSEAQFSIHLELGCVVQF